MIVTGIYDILSKQIIGVTLAKSRSTAYREWLNALRTPNTLYNLSSSDFLLLEFGVINNDCNLISSNFDTYEECFSFSPLVIAHGSKIFEKEDIVLLDDFLLAKEIIVNV